MTSRRMLVIWPFVIMAIAALWIAYALDVLPATVTELLSRLWPIFLVVFGLMLLLGRRLRFGNFLALGLSTALAVGVLVVAFSQQGNLIRTDNQKPFTQTIDPQINTVNIVLTTLNTQIDITPGNSATSAISGEFVGSKQSVVTSDYQTDGSTGTFTFVESQSSPIPSLEGSGRGKVTLSLPAAVQIAQLTVTIKGQAGDITLDATGTKLSELHIDSHTGNISLATLPDSLVKLALTSGTGTLKFGTFGSGLTDLSVAAGTGPLVVDASATVLKNLTIAATAGTVSATLPDHSGLIGDIKASGDIIIKVPSTIAANIQLLGNTALSPTYNEGDYTLNSDKTLVSKRSTETQMQIKIDSPGKATIQ
jgi:hypothetical protein